MKLLDAKECIHCGSVFERSESEADGRWESRQFCSRLCWAQSKVGKERFDNRKRTKKKCEYCGIEFETGGRAGKMNRRFCSRRCSAILKNKSGILGRRVSRGYVHIADANHPQSNRGYISEHRLIASKALGRPLKSSEEIHHLNARPADNVNSNLLVCTRSYHRMIERLMAAIYQLEHFAGLSHADAVAEARQMLESRKL